MRLLRRVRYTLEWSLLEAQPAALCSWSREYPDLLFAVAKFTLFKFQRPFEPSHWKPV